jgi:alpha-ribazole phosphatase
VKTPATALDERRLPGIESFVHTRFWWVRHAPVRSDEGKIYGQRDLSCDTSDLQVFQALALALPTGAHWVTSNLRRTRETADAILAAGHPDADRIAMEPLAALAEQNLGDWQGQDRAAFFEKIKPSPSAYWFAAPDERAPNGESFVDMCERVRDAIGDLAQRYRGRDIVVVAHGGTIRAALGVALSLPPAGPLSFATDNCAITRLDFLDDGDEFGWRVHTVNHQPWTGAAPADAKPA